MKFLRQVKHLLRREKLESEMTDEMQARAGGLGADRGDVIRLVVGEGVRLLVLGLVVGVAATFWLAHIFRNQLYGGQPQDPWVLGTVMVALGLAGLVAAWLPARRATKV